MPANHRDLSTLTDIIEPAERTVDAATTSRARAMVAAHARDHDDCRMLLEMLGLTTPPG